MDVADRRGISLGLIIIDNGHTNHGAVLGLGTAVFILIAIITRVHLTPGCIVVAHDNLCLVDIGHALEGKHGIVSDTKISTVINSDEQRRHHVLETQVHIV